MISHRSRHEDDIFIGVGNGLWLRKAERTFLANIIQIQCLQMGVSIRFFKLQALSLLRKRSLLKLTFKSNLGLNEPL